jgi:hypothetical protein
VRAVAILIALGGVAFAQPREPGWEVRIPDRIELGVGAGGTLPIAIAVDRGLAISKDTALIIDLAPDAGLAIKKHRLGRGDAADPEADAPRFAVPVKADTAGDHAVKLHIRFWLCGAKVCRPIDVRRSVTVAVTP